MCICLCLWLTPAEPVQASLLGRPLPPRIFAGHKRGGGTFLLRENCPAGPPEGCRGARIFLSLFPLERAFFLFFEKSRASFRLAEVERVCEQTLAQEHTPHVIAHAALRDRSSRRGGRDLSERLAGRVPGCLWPPVLGYGTKCASHTHRQASICRANCMLPLLKADARPPALLACAPDALVLADSRPPALLACALFALVLADACPPALLA